MTHKVWS